MREGPGGAGSGSREGGAQMQTGNQQQPIWVELAKRFGLMAGLFVAGAVTAFVYSYVPLHNAKNWEIGYLTERLEAKEEQLVQMETRLSAAEANATGRPDAETFGLLQDELDTADKTIKDLERRVAKEQKRADELEQAREHWKRKFEQAEKDLSLASQPAPRASSPPASAAGSVLSPEEPQDRAFGGGDVELQSDLVH